MNVTRKPQKLGQFGKETSTRVYGEHGEGVECSVYNKTFTKCLSLSLNLGTFLEGVLSVFLKSGSILASTFL